MSLNTRCINDSKGAMSTYQQSSILYNEDVREDNIVLETSNDQEETSIIDNILEAIDNVIEDRDDHQEIHQEISINSRDIIDNVTEDRDDHQETSNRDEYNVISETSIDEAVRLLNDESPSYEIVDVEEECHSTSSINNNRLEETSDASIDTMDPELREALEDLNRPATVDETARMIDLEEPMQKELHMEDIVRMILKKFKGLSIRKLRKLIEATPEKLEQCLPDNLRPHFEELGGVNAMKNVLNTVFKGTVGEQRIYLVINTANDVKRVKQKKGLPIESCEDFNGIGTCISHNNMQIFYSQCDNNKKKNKIASKLLKLDIKGPVVLYLPGFDLYKTDVFK